MGLLLYKFLDYLIQKYKEKVPALELLELFIKS